MDEETRAILEAIGSALHDQAYESVILPRWQAAAFSAQLMRIASGVSEKESTDAELREKSAALSYVIRMELAKLEGKKSQASKIRGIVAELYGYGTKKETNLKNSDQVVSTRATKHREFVNAWLANMDHNVEYAGLERAEMLRRELASIEDWLPKATNIR